MTLRFGLVGAGGIARSYVQVFADLAGSAIVGVADPDEHAARALAGALDVPAVADVHELLRAVELDAVIVCTPPVSHPEVVLTAIANGVAVLCEKPLAIGAAAAIEMTSAAEAAGVLFTMATKFRFVDDVVRSRRMVDEGALGPLIHLENAFASRVDMTRRWNSDPSISGGGVLIDNGTHSVDIARYFLGPIGEVLAVEAPRSQDLEVEDSAELVLRAHNGATATIELSWSYDRSDDSYLQVHGGGGSLRVGWQRSEYRAGGDSHWMSFGSGYDKIACMGAQLRNFCAALRGEEPLAISVGDAVASVQVIEAAYQSLRVGDWTPVTPVGPVESGRGEVVA